MNDVVTIYISEVKLPTASYGYSNKINSKNSEIL